MLHVRPPIPALAPFVECLWHSEDPGRGAPRERALPTGTMDLVFRLSEAPIRVFADVEDGTGMSFGGAVVCGARATYYVRDTSRASCSVGVHFRPAGATALLGVPAGELDGRHTPLEDLWGSGVDDARARLAEASEPLARIAALQQILLARVSRSAAPHAAVRHVLARLASGHDLPIAALRREVGLSHRRLIELFRHWVGLTPKAYGRIRRFQRLITRAAARGSTDWARLAAECGFYDQSHLIREFRAFAGIAPGAYVPVSPRRPNHVPVARG